MFSMHAYFQIDIFSGFGIWNDKHIKYAKCVTFKINVLLIWRENTEEEKKKPSAFGWVLQPKQNQEHGYLV